MMHLLRFLGKKRCFRTSQLFTHGFEMPLAVVRVFDAWPARVPERGARSVSTVPLCVHRFRSLTPV